MTSAQTMLLRTQALALVLALLISACASKDTLTPPRALVAPYAGQGDVLWAVAPLRNESGTSAPDELEVSDAIIAAAAQTRGVRCLPLNRSIQAMRALEMGDLASPEQALALAEAMGVDAIIVGSITAYDPYDPPTIGLALALYSRSGALIGAAPAQDFDPVAFASAPSDYEHFPGSSWNQSPHSTASVHLDARNHQTLMDLKQFAEGRHDPRGPMGWRSYTASMDLFTDFAAYQAVGALLREEWLRLARSRGAEINR